MIFKVNNNDPIVQRKGRVLAVIVMGLAAATLVLAGVNVANGQWQYNFSNSIFLLLMVGLFVINRLGYVTAVATATTLLTALGTVVLLTESNTEMFFIVLCIPILIASFLIAPWTGVVLALALAGSTFVLFGTLSSDEYPRLIALLTVAGMAYLFARSLDLTYMQSQQSRHEALHDSLTGLPNRALFVNRLQQAIDRKDRERNVSAVLFTDLDHFKEVNDSLGHDVGDELLKGVSERLKACLRPGDTAARLGGDEFTVLLDTVAHVGDAIRVAERITEEMRRPFDLTGGQVTVTTSIGIALSASADEQPGNLLRDADYAMYEAKREGKSRYKVFNSGIYAQTLRRLRLEKDLKRAIESEEFEVHYQPKVLAQTGEIVGVEALARWRHPERGLILPGEFIPLAEETGLIVPLGQWVLREACRQAHEWRERYPNVSRMTVSVNLSVRQFRQPDLVQSLAKILRETGLEPSRLELEITESMVTDDVEHAIGVLRELKDMNVQLAVDDFGTGYSSLGSFKHFPLDHLKIDRSFVDGLGQDPKDTAITQLVVDLAHTMGMQVVGEGVETGEQLARLTEMGCDVVQGFYFWKPLTGEEATALFADPSQWSSAQTGAREYAQGPDAALDG